MKIKNTEIKVVQGDITELKVDAIVNAANNKLVMGGGLAGAIRKKGGKEIEDEAVKLGPIKIGEAVATGAGKLPAKFVIHAATMGMPAGRQAGIFETDETKVRDSARSALACAGKLKLESVAIPALGCGVGHFPYLACAKIMAQEVFRLLRNGNTTLKEIIFCLYDKEAYEIFDKHMLGYLKHAVEVLQNGPFITVDVILDVEGKNEGGIVIIKRSNPPFGWALPGGFVDYGESLEEAVTREAKEETGAELLDLRQFHTYSDPRRDPRFHTIGTVFLAKPKGELKAGDDAAVLKVVPLSEIEKFDFAFDHKNVIKDYIKHKEGKNPF